VHRQPATLQRQLHARAVLRRAAHVLEQERAVDQFDVDAPILRGLDGAGDLDDAARGLLGIGVGARFGAFQVLRSSFANSARASFLAV
jgi:hypothetical protein